MNPFLNQYYNPYLLNQMNQANQLGQYQPNTSPILPPQQILQARGKESINALKMSPNSSVLIADETAPIVWKCVSDSLGNVTATPFDISEHKDEQVVQQENVNALILDLNERLTRLENNYEQSIIDRAEQQSNAEVESNKKYDTRGKKSPNTSKSNDGE